MLMPRFHRVRRTSEVNLERSEMGNVEKKLAIALRTWFTKDTEASAMTYHRIIRIQFSSSYKMPVSFVERPCR